MNSTGKRFRRNDGLTATQRAARAAFYKASGLSPTLTNIVADAISSAKRLGIQNVESRLANNAQYLAATFGYPIETVLQTIEQLTKPAEANVQRTLPTDDRLGH